MLPSRCILASPFRVDWCMTEHTHRLCRESCVTSVYNTAVYEYVVKYGLNHFELVRKAKRKLYKFQSISISV